MPLHSLKFGEVAMHAISIHAVCATTHYMEVMMEEEFFILILVTHNIH